MAALLEVLEQFPLDFSQPELQSLWALLSRSVYRNREIETVIAQTGLNFGYIDLSGTPAVQWVSILDRARDEGRTAELLAAVREVHPALGPRLDELQTATPALQPVVAVSATLRDPNGSGWRGFGAEKQIVEGVDTLLGISFLDLGIARSSSICRLTATFNGQAAHGTGALIGPNLLLTNHHVLHDVEHDGARAAAVEAWFDYELDVDGITKTSLSVVPCDAATIVGDASDDWAAIRTSASPPASARVLTLTGAPPPKVDDYVFIIQHPDGGPKMIGLSHNIVRYVDSRVLQYWTDTRSGSSGAPVFNSAWQVVGLHHFWVDAPAGEGVSYRNQGRRIETVLDGLVDRGVWAAAKR